MSPQLLAIPPVLDTIDLSKANGPGEAKVVLVNFPKKTVGIVFGQRTAGWAQRFNTYVVDGSGMVVDPQAVWDAPSSASERFFISQSNPPGVASDPTVLSIGPFDVDYKLAVYCSHKKPDAVNYAQSDPKFSFQTFKIGQHDVMSVTLVNAEDGGDSDYHDTVVGVAVLQTTK